MRSRVVWTVALIVAAGGGLTAQAADTSYSTSTAWVAPGSSGVGAGPTMGPLISGTTQVIDHTLVWTDYAYDDHGRAGCNPAAAPVDAAVWPVTRVPDPCEPTYPAAAAPGNAADLIQLQLNPQQGGVRIRAVLETLIDPKVPLLGIGLDLDNNPSTGAPSVPGGGWAVTGRSLGLDRMVLISSAGAQVQAWTGTAWKTVGRVSARVNAGDNTMSATVPSALLGRAKATWRAVGVLGLALPGYDWSKGQGSIYDLAFVTDPSRMNWQSNLQGGILAGQDNAAKAMATLRPAALARASDQLATPRVGLNAFIYHSKLNLGEGIQSAADSQYAGPYQPYGVWIPDLRLPKHPPLVINIHGSGSNHLEAGYGDDAPYESAGPIDFLGSPPWNRLKAIIVAPLVRGSGYDGPAEQDELDVRADALQRLSGDPNRVFLTGGSLGGVHAFRTAQLYPDLYTGALETVGAEQLGEITVEEDATGTEVLPDNLENLRNLPFRMSNSRLDEVELAVLAVQPDLDALRLQQLGYDYRYWQFLRRGHTDNPANLLECEVANLIQRGRVVNPAEVVYSQDPALYSHDAKTGLNLHHDHSYWMSGMVVRGKDFKPGDSGTVDVVSLARADRVPTKTQIVGVHQDITAGEDVCGPSRNDTTRQDAWYETGIAWSAGQRQHVSNGIQATFTKVAQVALDVRRMSIDTSKPITLAFTSDGPTTVRLVGAWRTAVRVTRAGAAATTVCPHNGAISVATATGTSSIHVAPTRDRCGGR